MKVSKIFSLIFILIACISGAFFYVRQPKSNLLADYISKFHARGGAYILIDRNTGSTVDSSFINIDENFALNPHNINKLFIDGAGFKDGLSKNITPKELLTAYTSLINNKDNLLTDEQLKNLKDDLLNNVESGISRQAQVKNIQISGVSSTDTTTNNQIATIFVGDFTIGAKNYALITLLEAPQAIKSTYGFNLLVGMLFLWLAK